MLLNDLHGNPETFLPRVYDNLWRAPYLVVVNFIFFEYTIPFVFRKRRYVIYNILLCLAALWVFMMLWSYGMYGWRQLGIGLGIYTPFLTDATKEHAVSVAMGYSMSSVFFFGVLRFIYNYVMLSQSQQQLKIEKQDPRRF